MIKLDEYNFPIGFSIVLCTFNGKNKIETTLLHLSKLNIPEGCSIELILVDNGSTDDTQEFTVNLWNTSYFKPYPLTIVQEKRAGKGYAIETGYDAAKLSYIITVDDDNWLDADYLINAKVLLEEHKDVAILQGKIEGIFESTPPNWINNFIQYFIIGSPIPNVGYFPANNCWVWGAGMIIIKKDWVYLRKIGFSFLTSKVAGKAAGEDNETAIALLMMGKRIYYSDTLRLKHFMPIERITWEKMKQNFLTFSYVSYYFFLYALVFDSYKKGYEINDNIINKKFYKHWYGRMRWFSIIEHVKHYISPQKKVSHLQILQHKNLFRFFFKLKKNSLNDIEHLKIWMQPILIKYGEKFDLPL